MLNRVVAVALVTMCVAPAAAFAAKVSPIAGDVLISSGSGFHRISTPTELAVGGQVMVSANGAASITYSENCVMPVAPAAITVVQRQPSCSEFPAPSYFGFARSNEEGLGGGEDLFGFTPKVGTPPVFRRRTETATQPPPPPEEPPPAKEPSPEPAPETHHEGWGGHNLLVIGGVVAGAGLLALLLAGQGGDSPASPE